MTDRILYQNSELFYYGEGEGSKVMLLFMDWSRYKAFDNWIEVLENDYTIYTFDLFFHETVNGQSTSVNEGRLEKIFQLFIDQEKIQSFEIAGLVLGLSLFWPY